MLVNKSTISAVFITLNTLFNKAFLGAQPMFEKIAMRVPSTSSQEDYAWLSNFPKMKRWIDEKAIKALKAFKYSVVNEDWEATVEVDRNDMEDDRLGIYAPQAQAAGISAKMFPDELVGEVVDGAFTNLCFDGQFFCDTDHPVTDANGTVSSVANKITKALSIATQAAAIASFGAAKVAMETFKDNEGRPLGLSPNVLMVPPALGDTAKALMTADRLEDGKVNLYKGACEVVVNPYISTATQWFILDTKQPVKPFIYQERKAPVFVSQTDPQADDVFLRKKFKFGAEARAAGGYGFWQLCVGSTGTT